ncbi:MAG: NusG domain II-containing protein [Nitrospirota bacterium]|nr:NusG domain II-containing protein [Nitrospirota bacterium]
MKETIKNTTLADRLLFLLLISLSVAGIFISRDALSQGSEVVIEVDGKPAYTLPLYEDRLVSVGGSYGDTLIEIKEKKVRVREAHCPNQICVKEGWISKGVIVCLPNKLIIIVGGSKKDEQLGIDAITG